MIEPVAAGGPIREGEPLFAVPVMAAEIGPSHVEAEPVVGVEGQEERHAYEEPYTIVLRFKSVFIWTICEFCTILTQIKWN